MSRLLLLLILLLSGLTSHSQYPFVKTKNISLDRDGEFIIVYYDLICADTSARFRVDVFFVDDRYNTYEADVLTGDIGPGVEPGKQKEIRWNLIEEYGSFTGTIKPVILVDREYVNHPLGGPGYALLSVLVPGLGDHYVMDPEDMKIKPLVRGISAYSMLLMGIIASERRYQTGEYVPPRVIERWGRTHRIDGKWINTETHYWLFRGDREVFFSLAGAIWVADVLHVLGRGSHNEQLRGAVNSAVTFHFSATPQGMGAGLVFRF